MTNIRKLLVLGLIPLALFALFAGEHSIEQPQRTLPKQEPLIVNAGGGAKYCFDVELATTPSERAKGLVFRRSLAKDTRMLFVFLRWTPEIGQLAKIESRP